MTLDQGRPCFREATNGQAPTFARSADVSRPRISLCMIVKDEEAQLADCLASATPFVDETVIVDTGSTDRTVAIAHEFGARVFHGGSAQPEGERAS